MKATVVEGFWLKSLKNSEVLNEEIKDKDDNCLKCLESIKYNKFDNSYDFEIIFGFKDNEYFTNKELKVKFIMIEEDECEKTEGTKIDWKDGKDLTVKKVKKTQKNKKTGNKRTVEKLVPDESFFNFFKSINPEEDEADEGNDNED